MSNKYIKLGIDEAKGIDEDGLDFVLAEVDEDGSVIREIGVDSNDLPRYKHPSKDHLKWRGYFDGINFYIHDGMLNDITPEEFEAYWRN